MPQAGAQVALRYFGPTKGFVTTVFSELQDPIARAGTAAIRDAASYVERNGRAAIRAAGLGNRIARGFHTRVSPRNGYSLDASMVGFHSLGFINIFERGGTIRGKPMLWLPLPSAPAKVNGRQVTPRRLSDAIGPLHSINIAGKPPMLAGYVSRLPGAGGRATLAQLRTGNRNARRLQAAAGFGGRVRVRAVSVPLFIGIPAAVIRQRLNISSIYDQANEKMGAFYLRRFREINAD
jgi:hypothetical protein